MQSKQYVSADATSQPNAVMSRFPVRSALTSLAIISGVINLLSLTGALFMLQVYDRVLSSRSIPTLLGLAALVAFLFMFQAFLDVLRTRLVVRVGEGFDLSFSRRAYNLVMRLPLTKRVIGDGLQPMRDVDTVRSFLSGQGPGALFDLPWIPLYLGVCFAFHFWIGMTATIGSLLLILLTLLMNGLSAQPTRSATALGMQRQMQMDSAFRHTETIHAMGMQQNMEARWNETNRAHFSANRKIADIAGAIGGTSRALRVALQSLILGVGAYLVIQQQIMPGVMIASSIMMGRAFAPVDMAIANWKGFLAARQSWARLKELFAENEKHPKITDLPVPEQSVAAEQLAILPPGLDKPVLFNVSFNLTAGSILGVIGPSGSGKSCLARALVGIWPAVHGAIRFDGANIQHWYPQKIGEHIGYLAQNVELFQGTIAQNIARFGDAEQADAIIEAAKLAGIHEWVSKLPDGYQTMLGDGGAGLSGGQKQWIGLARAVYGNPFFIVLDEPNSNLDAEGEQALQNAIRQCRDNGRIVVIIAHRSSAIMLADQILLMENGTLKSFGPRDEVLATVMKKPVGMSGNNAWAPAKKAKAFPTFQFPSKAQAKEEAEPGDRDENAHRAG